MPKVASQNRTIIEKIPIFPGKELIRLFSQMRKRRIGKTLINAKFDYFGEILRKELVRKRAKIFKILRIQPLFSARVGGMIFS